MALECYIGQLRQLVRPSIFPPGQHELAGYLLNEGRVGITSRRPPLSNNPNRGWLGRGRIINHAILNLQTTAETPFDLERATDRTAVWLQQACFTQDMYRYLLNFPRSEWGMHYLFSLMLQAGTSIRWEDDLSVPKGIHRVFTDFRTSFDRWVAQEFIAA